MYVGIWMAHSWTRSSKWICEFLMGKRNFIVDSSRCIPNCQRRGGQQVTFCNAKIKEACYSRVHVGISLHVSIFPVLAVLENHFTGFRSSHKSNFLSAGPANFHYIQWNPRGYLPEHRGMEFLQYETGCARGCLEVQKFTVSCLLKVHSTATCNNYHKSDCNLQQLQHLIFSTGNN